MYRWPKSMHPTQGVPCSGYGQTEWRPVPRLFLQSLNHVIFQNDQTSLKASSETILFFSSRTGRWSSEQAEGEQAKGSYLMGFETLSFHSISTSICPTTTFFLCKDSFSVSDTIYVGHRRMEQTLASCIMVSITVMHRNKYVAQAESS